MSLSEVLTEDASAARELSKVFEELHADCNVCCRWEVLSSCQIALTSSPRRHLCLCAGIRKLWEPLLLAET